MLVTRPITITKIGIDIPLNTDQKKTKKYYETVPVSSLFSRENDQPNLPVTLEDGEKLTLQLSDVVNSFLMKGNMNVRIRIIDAEGNIYSKFEKRHYNPKLGEYLEIKK